jgi:hypothetical protein
MHGYVMTDDFSQFLPKTAHARPQSADPARSPRAPPSRSRPQSGASPRARMAATASTQVGGASPRPASAAPTYHLLHSPISSSGLRIKSVPMSYGDGVDRRLTAGAKGDPALHRGDKTPAEQLQYELKMTGGLLRDAYKHLNSERVEVALAKAAEEKAKEAARQRRSEADEARREHEASEREFAAQMASQRRELNAEMEALRADGDAKLAEEKAKNAELRAKAEEVRELQRQLEAVERAAEKREAEAAAEYERRLAAEGKKLAAETARQTAAALETEKEKRVKHIGEMGRKRRREREQEGVPARDGPPRLRRPQDRDRCAVRRLRPRRLGRDGIQGIAENAAAHGARRRPEGRRQRAEGVGRGGREREGQEVVPL